MREWLTLLFDLSLAAGITALPVLVLRLLIGPLTRKYTYLLWTAVFFRAVCPVSYSSPFSVFRLFSFMRTDGNQLTVSTDSYQTARLLGIFGTDGVLSGAGGAAETAEAAVQTGISGSGAAVSAASGGIGPITVLFLIWAAGVVLLLLWGAGSWIRLRRQTALAVRKERGVYESDQISTAFVAGFFRPRIYLPAGLTEQEREFVLLHERMHIRRHDHQFKLLAWLAAVLHWFNPFLWISFKFLTRDMEMGCDECVLDRVGEEQKENYGSFLLAQAAPAGFPSGSPLAFGENPVKGRIRRILKYKKKKTAAVIGALVLAAAGIWFGLSNPSGQEAVSIIGGADGPTSIWLAVKGDPEGLSEKDGLEAFVQLWAAASGNRAAGIVYDMLSPELQARAEELGITRVVNENGEESLSMGWSSPFLAGTPVAVIGEGDILTAEITYPAMTSEPLWWVWKDYLTLKPAGDTWQVTDWECRTFFEITSRADAMEAYESWTPDYLAEDGGMESFASALTAHDLEGTDPDYYGTAFSTPEQGLREALHLVGGTGETQMQEDGSALVTIHFSDGDFMARMVQPGISEGSGIWLPEEILGS